MNPSLRDRLGRHLLIGFEADRFDRSLETLLATYRPAGVILFARNLTTGEQTFELLREIAAHLPPRPFLALDEEGGTVDRLKKFLPPLPSAARVAETGDRAGVRRFGETIGEALRLLGFNLDFAPVLDLTTNVSGLPLGSRTFAADADTVTDLAGAFIDGLLRQKILPCGKHFPGLGSAAADTHFSLPIVDKPMARLWLEDLLPYRQLAAKLPMVLVGHASYKAYDDPSTPPASLSSSVVNGLLRRKMNYPGVVATDDLDMDAVTSHTPFEQIGVRALKAGCDLLLVGQKEESIGKIVQGLERAARQGEPAEEQLEASRQRIGRLQRNLPLPAKKFDKKGFEKLKKKFEHLRTQYSEAPRRGAA